MRTVPKALKIAIPVAVFVAFVFVREAFFGYTVYFTIVPRGKVFMNGRSVSGWLHSADKGQLLIVTRSVSGRRESYWISMPGEKGGSVRACGQDWTAPRFPVLAIGDVNPPCLFPVIAVDDAVPPLERAPVFGQRSVEFTSDDGVRLKAAW
jgi:hypothetical protein